MARATDLSLLDAIRTPGYEAAVITTFSAYLPFFESVVLPRLRASGCKHVVVLIDHKQLGVALGSQESSPRLAGRFYTLIPVVSDGAFHPKIVMLAGKSKGLIHVGSHNLSLAGFGLNRELTGFVEIALSDSNSIQFGANVWRAIVTWANRSNNPISNEVRRSLSAVQSFAPWLDKPAIASAVPAVLFQSPGADAEALWGQVEARLPAKVREISVIGAFFDSKLEFLRRLQERCPRARLLVGVEPSSMEYRGSIGIAERYDWRDASKLVKRHGYLHAKAIYFRSTDSDGLLVLGSANPSAPAWLSQPNRNDECVVVLSGARAGAVAGDLGLAKLDELPLVSREDIALSIERARRESQEEETAEGHVFVACVEDGKIRIPTDVLGSPPRVVRGIAIDAKAAWTRRVAASPQGDLIIGDLSSRDLEVTTCLEVETRGGLRALGVLHWIAEIAALSRTGKQKALQDALEGLHGETTNLAELLSVVDRAIFEQPIEAAAHRGTKGASGPGKAPAEHPRPESLVVDLNDRKRAKAYARLNLRNASIALLLDLLSREMRLAPAADVAVDNQGRTEEEAMDQDDAPEQGRATIEIDDHRIADLCRGKVKRVVRRSIEYLKQAAGSSNPGVWVDAVLKLVAVLTVLRELRLIEQERRWRVIREQLVPQEERLTLLEGVMPPLFGRPEPIARRLAEYLDYTKIEDISKLKGLLLWLAWDSGVRLEDRFSTLEDPDDLWTHLFDKAALLATAQLAPNDEIALGEARLSIERCATLHQKQAASSWWNAVQDWMARVENATRGTGLLQAGQEIKIGDIALATAERAPTLRVVRNAGSNIVSMIDFGVDRQIIEFDKSKVASARL